MHTSTLQRLALMITPLLAISMARAATPEDTIPTGDELVLTITALDTKVFDAYNHCDLKTFGDYFSTDVEFFHDKAGLMNSRDAVVNATRQYICNKVRRELVGTLEVYPIKGYGAMEVGTHRFCQISTDKCEGVGKFLNIWRYQDGKWEMTRVISYDHREVASTQGK
ncbi:nuclear transport factor 2 family protein [Dyella sp. RRB7]|uniref:nuclear transport factor 2 family protein n=1 Tax=Dyella sp. RRB7 TaxID=2919502 RepID=UPI001FAA106D|nr:nuclear transport factor 2 family protein [Dyella sp. RRB7]